MLNKIIHTLLLSMVVGVGSVWAGHHESFSAIDAETFQEKIMQDGVVVIDIRTPGEVATGKITKDALEIDFYEDDFKNQLSSLDKEKTYLIYCRSGNRTRSAKEVMKELGFTQVYDLAGGISSWNEKLFSPVQEKMPVPALYTGEENKEKLKVVLIAGTFCPHCKEEIPKVEKEIFNKIGDQAEIVVHVTDGENGKKFNTSMQQGFYPEFDFEKLTGNACEYVPSWVILDSEDKVVDESCGNVKGVEGIISTLQASGVIFDHTVQDTDEKDSNIFLWFIFIIALLGGYWAFKK